MITTETIAFIELIDCGSVLKAAQKLGLSQPALSKQVLRFEQQFSRPLFFFEGRKKSLTPYGRSIFEIAKQARQDLETALNENEPEETELLIHIALRREIFKRVIPHLNIKSRVHFHIATATEAITLLEEKKVHIAVSHTPPTQSHFIQRKLFSFAPRVIVHKDISQAYGPRWYKNKNFYREVKPLCYRDPSPFLADWLKSLDLHGSPLLPKVVCDDWDGLLTLVGRKMGYCVLPSDITINDPDIQTFDIKGKGKLGATHIYAYFSPAYKELETVNSFIKSF